MVERVGRHRQTVSLDGVGEQDDRGIVEVVGLPEQVEQRQEVVAAEALAEAARFALPQNARPARSPRRVAVPA